MIHPSTLLRLTVFAGAACLTRAILREAAAERQPFERLPAPDRAKAVAPKQRVRPAGRRKMSNPPHDWDRVGEAADESFPASHPPAS